MCSDMDILVIWSSPSRPRVIDQDMYLGLLLLDSVSQLVAPRFGLISPSNLSRLSIARKPEKH
jgi:hypothetical protein